MIPTQQAQSPIEQLVFEFLDNLAQEGEPIPPIKEIRRTVGGGMGAVCAAVRAWKEHNAKVETQRLQETSDKIFSEAFNEAVDALRRAVVNDVETVRRKLEADDEERRLEFNRRETELLERVEHLSLALNDQLVKVGGLQSQLEQEKADHEKTRKKLQSARRAEENAKAELDRAISRHQAHMTDAQKEIERLKKELEQSKRS